MAFSMLVQQQQRAALYVCGTENVLKLGKETVFEVVDDPAVDVVESTSSATAAVCVYSST